MLSSGAAGKAGSLDTLTNVELKLAGSIACPIGQWVIIGSFRIIEQTRREPGYGKGGDRVQNVGILYVYLQNGSPLTQAHGEIEVVLTDPQGNIKSYYLTSQKTEKLDDTKSKRGSAYVIVVKGQIGLPGDYIKVLFKRRSFASEVVSPGVAHTMTEIHIDGDGSEILLDTTLYT